MFAERTWASAASFCARSRPAVYTFCENARPSEYWFFAPKLVLLRSKPAPPDDEGQVAAWASAAARSAAVAVDDTNGVQSDDDATGLGAVSGLAALANPENCDC